MSQIINRYKTSQPVRETMLSYGRQWIEEDDIQAVVDVLKGDYLTTGPSVTEFESAVANYVGAKYAVAFSNGTAALHGACFAAGISEGDEVITTPMTFAASANCILYMGAKPVFADIENDTYNINPKDIEKMITTKTKAIIPVDFTGQPADLDEIMRLAKEHDLVVIEDAAHAFGAEYKNKRTGSIADMTMFSFHPVKHITTGEGGIITTDNKDYFKKLVQFRSHGITRDPDLLQNKNEGPWYYEMQFLGYNYRMTDFQAALGLSQLKKNDKFVEIRKKYVDLYNKAFMNNEYISIPYTNEHCDSSWHLYIIRLNLSSLNASRKDVFEALLSENIGVNVHYIPVHLQPYYKQNGYKTGMYPIAEQLYEEMITLPLYPAMSEQDVNDVIRAVNAVIDFYKN